ncbi:hypothetical protein FHY18_001960 [Xanthomonas arboricola]|nr:hypothetical protein [Xanthomonas sp. 3793]
MDFKFITNKPKLFWLICLVALLGFVPGAMSVLLLQVWYMEWLHRFTFILIIFLWPLGFFLTIIYLIRQMAGKYSFMDSLPLRDQRW